MNAPETYEVFAIRYGTVTGRMRQDNFIITPSHPIDFHDSEMPLYYFVWAVRNENSTIVVDTGFERAEGDKSCRTITRLPCVRLVILEMYAAKIEDVIITHLH